MLSEALPETNFIGLMLGLAMLGVLQIMMWIKKWAVDRLKAPGPAHHASMNTSHARSHSHACRVFRSNHSFCTQLSLKA
eukprot:5349645-Amphidinium_carterae.1